ncbi:hypothetical protein ABPG75_004707 [Micractinium tetrahymenae]
MEPGPASSRQRPYCRADLLWQMAKRLAADDAGARWELEPPASVVERRRVALQQCEGQPFSEAELQWLLDTPCQEVLNQVHVKEVGGATKAAQAAAAAAARRRPRGPYSLVTWRHVPTGASLAVEVPLSVFRKQRGTVFAKWQQRAWRALYALRCQVGEEVWPEGCREAAAAGTPCWDDLEEETAALAKLPFCMPQKCTAQLLGLGTTKRLKAELLSKRKSWDDGAATSADEAEQEPTQPAKRAARRRRQGPKQRAQQEGGLPGQLQKRASPPPQQESSAVQLAPSPSTAMLQLFPPQPFSPLQHSHSMQEPSRQGVQYAQRAQHGLGDILSRQAHPGLPACGAPGTPPEEPGSLAALFDRVSSGTASAGRISPMPTALAAPQDHPSHSGSAPAGSCAAVTLNGSCVSSYLPFRPAEVSASRPTASSHLPDHNFQQACPDLGPPQTSLQRLFESLRSAGQAGAAGAAGAAGTAGSRLPSGERDLLHNSSQDSCATGVGGGWEQTLQGLGMHGRPGASMLGTPLPSIDLQQLLQCGSLDDGTPAGLASLDLLLLQSGSLEGAAGGLPGQAEPLGLTDGHSSWQDGPAPPLPQGRGRSSPAGGSDGSSGWQHAACPSPAATSHRQTPMGQPGVGPFGAAATACCAEGAPSVHCESSLELPLPGHSRTGAAPRGSTGGAEQRLRSGSQGGLPFSDGPELDRLLLAAAAAATLGEQLLDAQAGSSGDAASNHWVVGFARWLRQTRQHSSAGTAGRSAADLSQQAQRSPRQDAVARGCPPAPAPRVQGRGDSWAGATLGWEAAPPQVPPRQQRHVAAHDELMTSEELNQTLDWLLCG